MYDLSLFYPEKLSSHLQLYATYEIEQFFSFVRVTLPAVSSSQCSFGCIFEDLLSNRKFQAEFGLGYLLYLGNRACGRRIGVVHPVYYQQFPGLYLHILEIVQILTDDIKTPLDNCYCQ